MADINTLTTQLNTLISLVKGIAGTQISKAASQEMHDRVMGGIPSGSAHARTNSDGSSTRVLDSADGAVLAQAIADLKAVVDALPKAPGA